jgi:hypothetical protein
MGIEASNQTRTESREIPGRMETLVTRPFSTTIRRWKVVLEGIPIQKCHRFEEILIVAF